MDNRYQNNNILISKEGRRYLDSTLYPIPPLNNEDIYVTSVDGDRLDLLAREYFNNSKLWWLISICNPKIPRDSYFIPPGLTLRIPSDPQEILQQYREINN